MSSFQSEIKTLRADLSGSMSTMVAEAVAAHLPQVPYQLNRCCFYSCVFFYSCVDIAPATNVTLFSAPSTIVMLFRSFRITSSFLCIPLSHLLRLLRSLLLQSYPWPRCSPDHPHSWCPLTSPNRDLPDYTAQRFWLVYTLNILRTLFLVHSVIYPL